MKVGKLKKKKKPFRVGEKGIKIEGEKQTNPMKKPQEKPFQPNLHMPKQSPKRGVVARVDYLEGAPKTGFYGGVSATSGPVSVRAQGSYSPDGKVSIKPSVSVRIPIGGKKRR